MKSLSLSAPLAFAALISTAAAPAFAQDGHAVYRAQVLGERIAAPTSSTTAGSELRQVPGSQGRYLVHLGRSTEQAIAEALAAGEVPVWATLPVVQTLLVDGIEAYQRHHGRATRGAGLAASDLAQHAAPTLR
jgi:hypothetical protein